MMDELMLCFENAQLYWDWLEENHNSTDALWIKFAKVKSGIPSITYSEALEVSLCFGWIDGIKKSFDSQYFIQRFTPRRKNSLWSAINREKAERLISEGIMKLAGLEAIEKAKKNGMWEKAYSSQSIIVMPQDFLEQLNENPLAQAFFETLDSRNRYATLHRLETTKNPEVRKQKMNTFIEKFNRNQKLIP
jgi:uncharacterized protein YdeI (YjbR/CyaY-like superfamily)